MNYSLLFIILILVLNCNHSKSENLTNDLSIINDTIRKDIHIKILGNLKSKETIISKVLIENLGEDIIYIPVIFDYSQFDRECLTSYHSSPFFWIQFFDDKDSIKKAMCVFVHPDTQALERLEEDYNKISKLDSLAASNHKFKKKGFYWDYKYDLLKKQSFVLRPSESKILDIKKNINVNVFAETLTKDLSIMPEYENMGLRLMYYIDSTQIKDFFLLQSDIDSLHKNKIKIFHGTVYSNKVPLNFIKE